MHPDLRHLLSHNDPPTDGQIREVETLLDLGRKELSQLDDTILKLSLVLSELRSQKRRRVNSLSALKRVLAPIRRVPPEVLGEIFQWCCKMNWTAQSRSITNVRAPPLLLGHVSSLWRSVSQNTPRLWDYVCLLDDATVTERLLPFIRVLVERSGALPLTMELSTPHGDNRLNLAPIFEFHTRLEQMHLYLVCSRDLPTLTVETRRFPILKSLTVETTVATDETEFDEKDPGLADILSAFQDAPCLQMIDLYSDYISSDISASLFPWSQLISLTLDMPIDALVARNILRRCTGLETCSFESINCLEIEHASPPSTLTILHSLDFSGTGGPSPAFVHSFTLPALQRLFVNDVHWEGPTFLQLLSRSQFKLESLMFNTLPISCDDLISFLRLLPTLQTLYLAKCDGVTDSLFRAFTYIPGSRPSIAMPDLRRVTINGFANDLDGTVVADMVESLSAHRGDKQAPFPAINLVALCLRGAKFAAEVEHRLKHAARAPTFLVDKPPRRGERRTN
ncbi:hypothetical protein C8F04DRAFT_357937 [Mycena alexandri]|uniref:F-box domain-containing protein n=1 Tax=Mycena alexandri TaxID=1745969 RepID=A0AAD6S2V3_9AGAR|nr:hypothetical protein C8F04DRAFT_357937 [Mycena alexandri]